MDEAAVTVPIIQAGFSRDIFDRQRAACRDNPCLPLTARRDALMALETLLVENQEEIAEAICLDFGHRSLHETKLLEIFPTVSGLADARRHLKKWVRPQRRHVSLWFMGAGNRVLPQPKGVVGIISPWNYPLQLALCPLTSALAAGNRCMIKMATHSQGLCRLLRRLVSRVLPEELVAFLPGVPASEFTPLPFDHLIFTGSPRSGRGVMKTAAENLTPVTLELGGKSPTIVAADFDIDKAAERILYVKYMNAGQTCVAPDYLFLPENRIEAFVEKALKLIRIRYPRLDTDDYTSIVDAGSYARLINCLRDARTKGARVVNLLPDAEPDEVLRKIPPTLVLDITDDMALMQEEIFGPVLPVKTYRDLDQAIAYIKCRQRPLALYLFTNDRSIQERVIANTMSGGVCINDCAMHVAQHDLPFGGIGNSGMGHYHGYEGFLEFSKLRPVFKQAPMPATTFLFPPYGKTFERIYRLMVSMRWL
ncbi:MAG: coniferyl aldehyde dehydrogenase [Deltaproteobacteria bacterium]|nr:coniferyl aldehyde dehydrogenase [Deltaproteobacteria bacterium]